MVETSNADGAHRVRWISWIVLAAVLVRFVYLASYVTQLPFAYGPMGDSLVYLMQARDVRAGALGSPALIAFSPLYGYVLALLTSGLPSLLPILVQLGAGVLNLFLAHRLARTLFGDTAAIMSAALMLGYGALLFLESKLLTETLALTLLLLGMRAYVSAGFRTGRALACLGAGVLLALSVLMRASILFCIPLFVLCALMRWALDDVAPRQRVKRSVLCALGAASIFCANGLINLNYAGVFVPVIMVSRTLEKASKVEWTGSMEAFAHDGRTASPLDVVEQAALRLRDKSTPEPSLATRLSSLDLVGIVAGLPSKWALTFSNRESFQEYGFAGERSTLLALRVLPVSFGTLSILALAGCVVLFRAGRFRELWPLLPIVLGTLATTGLYHPSSRYRLAMVVPLLMLAGVAVAHFARRDGAPPWARVVLLLCVCGTTAHWFSQGAGNIAAWHLELAVSSYGAGEYEAASREANQALQLAPEGSSVRKRASAVMDMTRSHLQQPRDASAPF